MDNLEDNTEVDISRPELVPDLNPSKLIEQWSPPAETSARDITGDIEVPTTIASEEQIATKAPAQDLEAAEDELQVEQIVTAFSETTIGNQDFASTSSTIVKERLLQDAGNQEAGQGEEEDQQSSFETDDEDVGFPEEAFDDATQSSLFFVDTDPAAEDQNTEIVYDPTGEPLGQTVEEPSEEEIILQPRKFAKPQPIQIHVPSSGKTPAVTAIDASTQLLGAPTQISRKQKKALKKEKRRRNKSKKEKKGRRRQQDLEGSDVDWGSDGPPAGLLDSDGMNEDEDGEGDVQVLRDYLTGTILGATVDRAEADDDNEESDDSDTLAMTLAYDAAVETGDNEAFALNSEEEDNPDIEETESGSSDEEENEQGEDDAADDTEDDEDFLDSDVEGLWKLEGQDKESLNDEDLDKLFSGKDSWDETEWFIRNMDEALDGDIDMGNIKSRRAVFNAIENGDFGDEWDLTGELQLSGHAYSSPLEEEQEEVLNPSGVARSMGKGSAEEGGT